MFAESSPPAPDIPVLHLAEDDQPQPLPLEEMVASGIELPHGGGSDFPGPGQPNIAPWSPLGIFLHGASGEAQPRAVSVGPLAAIINGRSQSEAPAQPTPAVDHEAGVPAPVMSSSPESPVERPPQVAPPRQIGLGEQLFQVRPLTAREIPGPHHARLNPLAGYQHPDDLPPLPDKPAARSFAWSTALVAAVITAAAVLWLGTPPQATTVVMIPTAPKVAEDLAGKAAATPSQPVAQPVEQQVEIRRAIPAAAVDSSKPQGNPEIVSAQKSHDTAQ